jgi:hypothetical protein
VIIDNLDIRRPRSTPRPFKADAPLLINTHTELTGTAALQGFEPIAPQRAQFVQIDRRIENFEPPVCLSREALELANKTTIGKSGGSLVTIATIIKSFYQNL